MSESTTQKTDNGGAASIAALMAALLVAIFAFQLNASMLSPALVTMQNELNTTADAIGLTQTVFFTAAALFSLFLPRLADLKGRKKVLSGMLALTGIGCLISAIAPNVTVLMIGRIFQGVAGPVVPMCLIILHQRVTEEKRYTRLMSILTSVNGGIAGVDAILGGWLAGTLGIAFLAAYLAINEIEKLAGANWILVVVLIVIAAVFFVVFWRHEGSAAAPMVSTHYMKQRRTWGLLVTTLLTMTGVFAIMNGVVPAIAQDTTLWGGMSASTVSFATLTPYALLGLAFGPVAGVLASKFGYHVVLRAGLVVTIVGALFGIFVANNPSIAALVVISVVLGISYAGTANIMLNGLGIVLSPKDNPGYLPGMNAGAFNLGAGLSFAVLYAVMNSFTVSGGAAAGYAASLVAGAVLVGAALLCSFLIPKEEDADNS